MDLLFLVKVFLVLGSVDYLIDVAMLLKEHLATTKQRKIKRIGVDYERTDHNEKT